MEGRRGATKAGKIFKNSAAKRVLPSIFFSRWVVLEVQIGGLDGGPRNTSYEYRVTVYNST